MSTRRAFVLGAVSIASLPALLLGGCSSSSDSGRGDISVTFIGSTNSPALSFPEAADGARAAIEAANASGGIAGRHLVLTVCNDHNQPSQAAACAQSAAQARSVAVVGGITVQAASITSVLEQANILYTGQTGVNPSDLSSPISFPMEAGTQTVRSLGAEAVAAGCRSTYLITSNLAPSISSTNVEKAAILAAGGKVAGETLTPVPATDYSPAVGSALSSGAQCVTPAVNGGPEIVKLMPVLRHMAPNLKVIASAPIFPNEVVDALGPLADGVLVTNSNVLPSSDSKIPGIRSFLSEMKAYAPHANIGSFSLISWLGARVIVDRLKTLHESIDARALLNSFRTDSHVNTYGIVDNLDFSRPGQVPGFPRLFNTHYVVYSIRHGSFVLLNPSSPWRPIA